MENEIVCQLNCPCNQKVYKSIITLKAHQKSQAHIYWQQQKEQREVIIKINKLENENSHLRRLNILLMERISNLEE